MDEATARLMMERVARSIARDEASDVERWRNATAEERSRMFIELCRVSEKIIRARGFPEVRPPLGYFRLRRLGDGDGNAEL
jgi:hypothetical protein